MLAYNGSPWLLAVATLVAWTPPALAGDFSGAVEWDGVASTETSDLFPATGAAFDIAASPLELPGRRPGAGQSTFHNRRHHSGHWTRPESYMLFKGGGLFVAEDDGLYLGVEVGGSVDNVVDFGVSLDYFHRSSSERVTLGDTQFEDLPVELVATLDESSAHLVPLGLTLRVHLPFGGRTFAPFVSGTVAYETLFLNNIGDPSSEDPVQRLLDEDETFNGVGWQAAAGLDMRLSANLGIYGELGLHRSSPGKEVLYEGLPVDLKVNLDGAFLRGGLRFNL